MYNTSNKGQAI